MNFRRRINFFSFVFVFLIFSFVFGKFGKHRRPAMAEKQVKSSSAAAFERGIQVVCSDEENDLHMASSATCSDKTSSKKSSSAKSRSSSYKSKKESVDKRMDSLEQKMDERLSSIFQIVQSLSKKQTEQETEGSASQIPVSQSQEDHPLGVRGPVSEVDGPSGMRRPLLPLDNELNVEYGLQQYDLFFLTPGQKGKDSLGLLSDTDRESGVSSDNLGNVVESK